jgi:hypothetical protein
MVQEPIVMSAITPVAVAAILILGILAAIATTKQAFAWTEEIQGGYKTNEPFTYKNGLKYSCNEQASGAYPYYICKPIKTGAQLEEGSQTALLKQDCMQLKEKMTSDEAAAAQYKSKDCESVLK